MSNLTSYTNAVEEPQVGEIIALPENTAPPGYLKCDGSIVSQATYSELYEQVGLIQDSINIISRNGGAPGTSSSTGLVYANGIYVLGASFGALATSTNAITWTARTSGTTSQINTVAYGNGLYVYGGNGGALATSTNAITWTARTSGTTSLINTVAYVNGLYVYGGEGGALATSTDAITWTARTSGTTSALRSIIYANGLYVYGGGNNAVAVLATSTNAITWTARNLPANNGSITALTYGNGLYVAGMNAVGAILTSTDAITWNYTGTKQLGSGVVSLEYVNGLYAAFTTNGLFTSTNAINWTMQAARFLNDSLPTNGIYANNKYAYLFSSIVRIIEPYSYNTSTSFALPNIIASYPLNFYIKY